MIPLDLQRDYQLAVGHHQAGRIGEAELLYRKILASDPTHADAIHMLGVVAHQAHNQPAAVELVRRAIALNPRAPGYFANLGLFLLSAGDLDGAIEACQRAIALQPAGIEAYCHMGTALTDKGLIAPAIEAFRTALALRPSSPLALNGMATALISAGRFDEAIAHFNRSLSAQPDNVLAYIGIGNALQGKEQYEEAMTAYRRALAIQPNSAAAHNNLGAALSKTGKLDAAIAEFQAALAIAPGFAAALNNLGNALKEAGELDGAIDCYRKSVALAPDPHVAGNLAYTLHFHPDYGPEQIWRHHVQWNQTYAAALERKIGPHANAANPSRRLRIGYVSPDLRAHPVGRFMLPLLANHERHAGDGFEICCYAGVRKPDAITRRLQNYCDAWRSTLGLSDDQLADLIRQDRIDILVDLTMHMEHNRLLTFARKPAPVQVTYLAYCGTTGLTAIDYRLTDPYLDPSTDDDRYYSEKSVRLPRTYWCYDPSPDAGPVTPLPALSAGFVTFGSLNNFCKVTTHTMQTWCELLDRVPDSRLIVHAPEGSHRQKAHALVAARGIDPQRLVFVGRLHQALYFAKYHEIDIALDPFPYTGGTTSCDALWMGVPVVTLAGATAVSRGGVSLLSNLGLPELVATSSEQYARIVAELAADLPRLTSLRAALRGRMLASPLMNAPAFARDIETAFRGMWKAWCDSKPDN